MRPGSDDIGDMKAQGEVAVTFSSLLAKIDTSAAGYVQFSLSRDRIVNEALMAYRPGCIASFCSGTSHQTPDKYDGAARRYRGFQAV